MPIQNLNRDNEPIGLNIALGTSAFMTAWDRTRSIKGGAAGLALAGGFMLARKYLKPSDQDAREVTSTIWNAVEFSAITSLLGSSMMRGGFLYRAVGKPIQRAAATRGYRFVTSGLQEFGPVKGTRSVHELIKSFKGVERTAAEDVARMMQEQSGEASRMMRWILGRGKQVSEASLRVAQRYTSIAKDYLSGIAIGPRGPFEITSGLFDVSKRMIDVVGRPRQEFREIVRAWMGKKYGFMTGPAVSFMERGGLAEEFYRDIEKFARSKAYRASKGIVRYRKYFEGVFGSPTVGELVQKYGSIRNIPIEQYASANVKDVFYGAVPGLLLASPILAYKTAKFGVKKGYNKIVGHHSGWANKETEGATESDFTAGASWTHVKNALNMFSRYRRKALVSGALAATLATTPTSVALAKDIGIKAARATQIHTVSSAATRAQKWRDVVDTVVAMTDKNPAARKKAAQMIYETGVHESGFLKNVVQIGGGPARGITQVERATARDIIQNYAKYRTGVMDVLSDVANVEKSKLLEMSGEELGSILENNQAFAAALTRYKYKRVPTPIPETMEERASYWAKNYWVGQVKGKTPAEIKAMRDKKAAQFIKHNVNFSSQTETVGLTNDVMHNKRTQHQVMDVIEKTKHLFKI